MGAIFIIFDHTFPDTRGTFEYISESFSISGATFVILVAFLRFRVLLKLRSLTHFFDFDDNFL